jgi:hypothetical protein
MHGLYANTMLFYTKDRSIHRLWYWGGPGTNTSLALKVYFQPKIEKKNGCLFLSLLINTSS